MGTSLAHSTPATAIGPDPVTVRNTAAGIVAHFRGLRFTSGAVLVRESFRLAARYAGQRLDRTAAAEVAEAARLVWHRSTISPLGGRVVGE